VRGTEGADEIFYRGRENGFETRRLRTRSAQTSALRHFDGTHTVRYGRPLSTARAAIDCRSRILTATWCRSRFRPMPVRSIDQVTQS
jgi:hypothetical protein